MSNPNRIGGKFGEQADGTFIVPADPEESTERKPSATARTIASTTPEQDQPEYEAHEYLMTKCEDCGGTGLDSGALFEAEPCTMCAGYGDVLAPVEVEKIAKRTMERAKTVDSKDPGFIWSFEERIWRVGE